MTSREANDDERLRFFEETREAYVECAAEAKLVLASRLDGSDADEKEDEVEEEDADEEEEED